MPNPAVGDILRVVMYTGFGSQYAQNVFLFEVTNTVLAGLTEGEIGQGMDTVVAPLWQPTMTTNVSIFGFSVQNVGGSVTGAKTNFASTKAGTSAGTNVSPPQVAPLISLTSTKNAIGKGLHGRHYCPFTARDNVAAGVLTAGAITNYSAILPMFTGTITLTIGANGCSLRYVTVDNYPIILANKFYIQTAVIKPFLAQQKRRSFYSRGDALPF